MLPCEPLTSLPNIPAVVFDPQVSYVDIWWWPYNAKLDWEKLRSKLTLNEQTRATAFHFNKDAIAFAAGRYLQRFVLSKYMSLPPMDLDIIIGLHGKPHLANAGIAFNLTNAEGMAAIAVSRTANVLGIDAEPVGTAIEAQAASLFCSPAESEIILALQGSERQSLLLSYWTLKESYLKAVGTGLIAAPGQLNFQLDRTTNSIRIENALPSDDTHWHHRLLHAPCGHLIALSVQSDQAELVLRQQKLPDPA
jgi:4'-phosphopantetheinyl transferase